MTNQTFIVENPKKGEPVTSCMDVCKTKIQYDGSPDKLKLRTGVRLDQQNKKLVWDTWSPTDSVRTLEYFFPDPSKHKARVHQLNFIGALLQAKV